MPDTPTNNFATFNAVAADSTVGTTLSNGNLSVSVAASGGAEGVISTFTLPRTGKWYWEYRTGAGGGSIYGRPSIITADEFYTQTSNVGAISGGSAASNPNGVLFVSNSGQKRIGDSDTSFGSAVSAGDIIGNAYDADTGQWYIYINNSIQASGAAISESIKANFAGKDVFILHERYNGNGVDIYNFGQDSSFDGNFATSNANSDGEGHGSFAYAPPSGYLALCSQNLPEPAIVDGTEHFNPVLYTGNGSTQNITGVGFGPDFVWMKAINDTSGHQLYDTVRGATKRLRSQSTGYESTESTGLTSFDGDGFSLGDNVGSNENNKNYVSWNWLAGGAAPEKTYAVTVSGDSGANKYRFDGNTTDAPTLNLQEGGTYTFDQSDSSNSGHPLRFSTTSNGTHGGGSEYTTGVTTTGTPGNAGAKTVITVAASAATLYYYCTQHSGMGGQVNTNATFGSTHLDGSILSTVSANTTAGFSVISYTGNGSSGQTVAHGLSSAPEFIIHKDRDTNANNNNWNIYHAGAGDDYGYFTTAAFRGSAQIIPNGTDTIELKANLVTTNESGDDFIMYAFHSVEGYSKVGSYEANNNADGPMVFTGFRPAWVMIKAADTTSNWFILDNTRDTDNAVGQFLYANLANAEAAAASLDFLSNGFKVRNSGSGGLNYSGTYIYLAFAEQPFKFANAR